MNEEESIIEFATKVEFINLAQKESHSIRKIKWENFKNGLKYKKQNAYAGFKMGLALGFTLGFITGLPSYIKSRKLLELLIPMVFSGCFFGSIFSIGPFIHGDDVIREEYIIYKNN